MLRFIANVRFEEAAPQRRNRLRMSAKGREQRYVVVLAFMICFVSCNVLTATKLDLN